MKNSTSSSSSSGNLTSQGYPSSTSGHTSSSSSSSSSSSTTSDSSGTKDYTADNEALWAAIQAARKAAIEAGAAEANPVAWAAAEADYEVQKKIMEAGGSSSDLSAALKEHKAYLETLKDKTNTKPHSTPAPTSSNQDFDLGF